MTALLPTGFGLLLHSAVLLLFGLFALRLTRQRGPAVQSLVGRAALAGVALMLIMTPLTGHLPALWRVTIQEPTPAHKFATPPETGGGRGLAVGGPLAAPSLPDAAPALPARSRENMFARFNAAADNTPTQSTPTSSPSRFGRGGELVSRGGFLNRTLAALWGLGTIALLLWLGLCQWHLTRLRRTAAPITYGPAYETLAALTPRPPRLLSHPSVLSPFLAGIRNAAIFLPDAYETEFDPITLRAILAHELAHVARRDTAWTLASRLLSALLWPQPLLWLLCRRLEQIGEEACDEAVLARDCSPRAYADCLLTLAERRPLGRRERALGAGVTPFRSSLGRRIGRILDKGTHAMSTVSTRLRLTIAALTVAAALGGALLVSSAPAQSPGPDKAALTPRQRFLATLTPEQRLLQAERERDMMNLNAIGLAITQYTQDHDEFFPNAAHWMDELSPYLKDKTVFYDPFQPGKHRYAYAFNRRCSEKSLAAIAHPSEAIIAFDSTLGTRNASDTGQSLRATPARITTGSSCLFVDGHVKWIWKANRPSFAIKWDQRFRYRRPPTQTTIGGAFLVSSAPAQIAKSVMTNPAVKVMQEYLTDRAAGHYSDAYALLSANSKKESTFAEFQKADNSIIQRLQSQDAQASLLKAMGGLFFDMHNTLHYRYRVLNSELEQKNDSSLVLVSAEGPGLPVGGAILKIAMVSEAGGTPHLDRAATYFLASPATFNHASAKMTDFHCEINMKQAGIAIWDYAYHHNDRFPDADGWMDAIKPYLKDEDYYHDPAAPDSERYSYAYNRNLSGVADNRVSNISGTVMLFESSLNVRNASDTGQSLRNPSRHPGHYNFMCVGSDRQVKDSRALSFVVRPAPPDFFSTAPLEKLIKMRGQAQVQLAPAQKSFADSDQQFEKELHQALPQEDAQKLSQVRELEMRISLPEMDLERIRHLRTLKIRNYPGGQPNWHHSEMLSEAWMRTLLRQEADLLPTVSKSQLARLHALAVSRTNWNWNVEALQAQVSKYNKEIQRRQQKNEGH